MCQLPADQNERVIVYDKYMITLFTLEEVMRQSTIQLQCNHCGGELTVDAERSIIVCPYCGTKVLITDSDAVAVEKIRQQTAFRQWEREDHERKEQERSAYRNSKAGVVSLVFAVICGCGSIGCFSSARNIYKVLYGAVLLIQTASFLLSFLERKEVINLQKRLPFDGVKLPSLLMATGFLLFIPSLILATI